MKILRGLVVFLCICFCAAVVHAEVLKSKVTYQGKKLEYAYYIPSTLGTRNKVGAIVLVPGLNGKGEDMIDQRWIEFADKTHKIIIAPTFVFEGDDAFAKKKSYQYPNVWSGNALKTIFKKIAKKKGYQIKSLYMMGFSAGAQFVGRYAFANPQQVKKCAIIASGGNDKITSHVGVKFFYGIGYNDASNRREFANTFEKEAAKHNIDVVKKVYAGTGHTLTQGMQDDVREFFKFKSKK